MHLYLETLCHEHYVHLLERRTAHDALGEDAYFVAVVLGAVVCHDIRFRHRDARAFSVGFLVCAFAEGALFSVGVNTSYAFIIELVIFKVKIPLHHLPWAHGKVAIVYRHLTSNQNGKHGVSCSHTPLRPTERVALRTEKRQNFQLE